MQFYKLNYCQKNAYGIIINHNHRHGAFFTDGPGKNFSIVLCLEGSIAFATFSMLFGSLTAHSLFKISINFEQNSSFNILKQSGFVALTWKPILIRWDENSIMKRSTSDSLANFFDVK